jgi:hypothetical protein
VGGRAADRSSIRRYSVLDPAVLLLVLPVRLLNLFCGYLDGKRCLAVRDDLVDETVLDGLLGGQDLVAFDVEADLLL